MTYNPDIHHRRSIRMRGFNYSLVGTYFITICTSNKACILGNIHNEQMRLNELGQIAEAWWENIPYHFPTVQLDQFVIMPNHIHGIVAIGDRHTTVNGSLLGRIVAYFKYQSSKQINLVCNTPGQRVWQRNYWEHIVRNEAALSRIQEYILDNPVKWNHDKLNPQFTAIQRTVLRIERM